MSRGIELTPDAVTYFPVGPFEVNATIGNTWIVMALLIAAAWGITRRLELDPEKASRRQIALENLVQFIRDHIREMTQQEHDDYLSFLGTLFLFISLSNLLEVVPGFNAPTGSLSTTSALALVVFFAVPIFGIRRRGLLGYLKLYIQPSILMAPFNIIGELSRTLALAVRLFGNVMSGSMIVAVLLSLAPLFVPLVMEALGLLIGQIQAYIFAALATIYIASATRVQEDNRSSVKQEKGA